MPGYLPDPPQLPIVGMGAHPTPQVHNSPAWNNPQALAQGIAGFAQNYMLAQQAKKKEAWERVQWSLGVAGPAGIPIDDKQLVKDIKLLRLPVALDPESAGTFTAPQPPGTKQSSTAPSLPQAEAMMLAGGAMPQGVPPGVVSQPTAPGVQGPVNPATAQVPIATGPMPSAQMALSPEVSAAAARPGPSFLQDRPMPTTLRQFLSTMQQQGWDEKQLRASMQNVLKGALQGDSRALEMASRLGLTKVLGQHDEIGLMAMRANPDLTPAEAYAKVTNAVLYDMMGGPQREAKKMEIAKTLSEYFPNESGGPDLEASLQYVNQIFEGKKPTRQPRMSFDQYAKTSDWTFRVMEQFPTSGNLPMIAGAFMMAGKTQEANAVVAKIAEHFPSKAGLEQLNRDRAFGWDQTKFNESQKMDMMRMQQAKSQFDQQYALNTLQFYQGKATSEFNKWWDIFRNEESTAAEKEDAVRGLADALIKSGVDVTVEQIRHWYWPFSTEPRLKIKDRGKESSGTKMGGVKMPKNPFGEEDANYYTGLTSYLSKLPGFSWDFFTKMFTGPSQEKE